MGIFDRDTQTATADRPKNETSKTESVPVSSVAPAKHQTATNTNSASNPNAKSGGPKTGPTLKVRWTNQDGEIISENVQTLAPTGKAMGTFHIAKPEGWPSGSYKLEVLMNETTAATMDFDVR